MLAIEDIETIMVQGEKCIVYDLVPVIAREHGWQYEFDIPSEQPADYFDIYTNTEVREMWHDTIDFAVGYLNEIGSPDIKFIWNYDIVDEIDGVEFPVYLTVVKAREE